MKDSFLRFFPLALAVFSCLVVSPVEAQITGSIRGTVTDAQGAVVPGVTVTASSPVLVRGAVSVVTDAGGGYRIPALQPGDYELVAELAGFQTVTISNLTVGLQEEVIVNVTLELAGVEEAITVTSEPLVVQKTVTGLRERIEPATIENIPLKDRQFLDLVALVPGTAPRPPSVQEGATFTVLGNRSTTNGFFIDGMQNRDMFSGGIKEFFVQDAIQEFNAEIAGFMPEHGLASGAVVNIITKSGTNQLQARGFLFTRNDALNTSNVEGQDPQELSRYNVGGTLGGPIVKDKTWFFAAAENLHETRGLNLDLSTIPPLIASGLVSPAFDGNEPFDTKPVNRRLTLFGKVNHRINDNNQLFVSTNVNDISNDTLVRPPGVGFISPPTGSISLPSTASDVREDVFSINGRHTAFLGQNQWLLESTIHHVRGDFEENIDKGGGFQDEISTLTFDTGTFWNTNFPLVGAQKTRDNRLEWAEDLSYFADKHTAKFGFSMDRLATDGFFRTPVLNIVGNTALDTRFEELGLDISNQQSNRPLQAVNGREGYDIDNTVFSFYAQDTWEAAENLTINGGIRWDYETLFEGSKTNFGPRVGVTWDPWKDGRTVIRASAGRFYDAGLLGPAFLAPELGGTTFSLFGFQSMPRGGAFFNNPSIGAFGPLQAGGNRFLSNPELFSFLMPEGQVFSRGGITITGKGQPYIIYELLGIPVPDPTLPPILSEESIPVLTDGRLTAQDALDILNAAFPNPREFPQFFYIPEEYSGHVMKQGTLAYKHISEDVEPGDVQSVQRPWKTAYTDSYNIGVERQLFGSMSLDFQYFRRESRDLPLRRVANLRDEPVAIACIDNTVDGEPCNRQLQPIGFLDVHALTLAVRKRMSNRYSFLLSYTFTDATDNFNTLNQRGGGGNFNLQNMPEADIGRSLNTPEHVYVFSGVYQAPWAIDISGVFSASSGRPFNAAGLPVDSDGDSNFDNRLIGTPKGGFLTDPFAQADLRLAKTFGPPGARITVLAEVFNLFNRRNPIQVNQVLGSPTFGETVEASPGREWQLGLRADF